jgi:hypothetical protein
MLEANGQDLVYAREILGLALFATGLVQLVQTAFGLWRLLRASGFR